MKKTISVLTAVVLTLALLSVTAFAAPLADTKAAMVSWLQNPENTQFDYSETSFADSLIDWTAFTLTRAGAEAPAEYEAYIRAAVENSFDSLYPSDLARITLAVTACGMDAKSIGGHDLLAALKSVDYSSQIYLSSITFPLLAMNFKSDFDFSDELKAGIVGKALSVQQPDGGWAYCSEDLYGYGVYSDPDSTAMALQALAPYYKTDEAVKAAVDKALAYLQTQIGDTGAVLSYGSPSGESTAQVVLALCELHIAPTDEAFAKNGKTLLDGLKTFITENGGALNYKSVEDPLTTYQVLMALDAAERFEKGMESEYTYAEPAEEPTEPVPTDKSEPIEPTTASDKKTQDVEIPKTGAQMHVVGAFVAAVGAAAVLTLRKKDA